VVVVKHPVGDGDGHDGIAKALPIRRRHGWR
jgi:hypothetical protein